MVKSWVCPRCLGDLDNFYVEEGDVIIASNRIVCPDCGYTLENETSQCFEEIAEEEPVDTAPG